MLRERLGINLVAADAALTDDEPFIAGFEEKQALTRRLETAVLAGGSFEALAALAQSGNEYPAGAIGARQRERRVAELATVANALAQLRDAPPLPPHAVSLAFELDGEPWRLSGNLAQLWPGGQTLWRLDALRASDRIDAALRHLVLCAAQPDGVERVTTHIASDQSLQLATIASDEARARLAELLAYYRAGLTRPLRFFPRSAWAYVEQGFSLAQARAKWEGERHAGENANPYYALALRGAGDPLDAEFEEVAKAVFWPYLPAKAAT